MKNVEANLFKTLMDEDMSVLVEVQKGMKAGQHPSEGLVSIREERCFHFQEYIKQATADNANDSGSQANCQAAVTTPTLSGQS